MYKSEKPKANPPFPIGVFKLIFNNNNNKLKTKKNSENEFKKLVSSREDDTKLKQDT